MEMDKDTMQILFLEITKYGYIDIYKHFRFRGYKISKIVPGPFLTV